MDILRWVGLRDGDKTPSLDSLMTTLRQALPNDEGVVLRYIAVVVVLLGKVACADGRFSDTEHETLRVLLGGVDRLSSQGVDAICTALRGKLPRLSESELSLCYRELKALCDARERAEVMRLLTQFAGSDGPASAGEQLELSHIAEALGVSLDDLN